MQQPNWPYEGRRDHLQILIDILELCETPNAKTQILHSVNTNFKLLETYLLQLHDAQLIEKNITTQKYSATKKGLKFIKDWKALQTMIKPTQTAITVNTRKCVVDNKEVIVVAR